MKKNNTDQFPALDGWGIISDICHKAKNNILMQRALKKVSNMNQNALQKFLGEVQTLFGRLKKIVSDISLEATASFIIRDFFKTKNESGIFAYVDSDIFNWFDSKVKNSPAKELANYKFTENITEKNIIGDAEAGGIYEEVDFAHIKQICERHIVKGEKLLEEDGFGNLFWVRNKKGALCEVDVHLHSDGWFVFVRGFDASDEWDAGSRSFFRN